MKVVFLCQPRKDSTEENMPRIHIPPGLEVSGGKNLDTWCHKTQDQMTTIHQQFPSQTVMITGMSTRGAD